MTQYTSMLSGNHPLPGGIISKVPLTFIGSSLIGVFFFFCFDKDEANQGVTN